MQIIGISVFPYLYLLLLSSITYWKVIKKGGGNGPFEALATLCVQYEEGAKFYHMKIVTDNIKELPEVICLSL